MASRVSIAIRAQQAIANIEQRVEQLFGGDIQIPTRDKHGPEMLMARQLEAISAFLGGIAEGWVSAEEIDGKLGTVLVSVVMKVSENEDEADVQVEITDEFLALEEEERNEIVAMIQDAAGMKIEDITIGEHDAPDYDSMTVDELKAHAEILEIDVPSRIKRDDLIALIKGEDNGDAD